jgi:signal transduction histidine kinase
MRTLRFRLTLWNSVVFVLMVVVTLAAVRESLRFTLRHEADTQLKDDAREIRLMVEELYPARHAIFEELDRKAVTHTHRSLYVRVFDEEQRLLWSTPHAPPNPQPLSPIEVLSSPTVVGEFGVVQFRLQSAKLPPWTVRVGASYALLDADVAHVTRLMLIVGAAVMFITPLGGYWLAGRATRPLAYIINTTGKLHPSSLRERLPLRGTGDELDRLSLTINGFLDRIALYVSQNREFTANAAHELRSPLAAIQSSIEVALNTDRPIDEYKELLCDILDETGNLAVLVNQLLLLAESDAGRLNLSQDLIDFGQIVERSVEMFRGVAESRNIELCVTCSRQIFVPGDGGRLRQVINNLLDNALKYSSGDSQVLIDLRPGPAEGEVQLKVRDFGIGIPQADLPHIFERFFRGDKARERGRAGRGTGLGLSICKSIVIAHGGRIGIENATGKGACVTVVLPTSHKGEIVKARADELATTAGSTSSS